MAVNSSPPLEWRDLPRAGAIIVAAGESLRMEGIDKVFAPLAGKPLIAHTLEPFLSSGVIAEIVLVMHPSNIQRGQRLADANGWTKVKVVPGGKRRQDSVMEGLKRLGQWQWVLVHDGARPCMQEELIYRGLQSAMAAGAAIAAVPAQDTIKEVDSQGLVSRTANRDRVVLVQTPQVFRRTLLEEAFLNNQETVTDEATLVERLGRPVQTFMGSPSNIKVTTTKDLVIAEAILESRRNR